MGDQELTLLRRDAIGFIFQFFNLLPMLTAEENVALPLRSPARRRRRPGWTRSWPRSASATADTTARRELSGGQPQRVAIARALIAQPTVMFADEPTGNLDSTTSEEILKLLRDTVDAYGQTTLMVTHDPRAAAMADRILFLADGLIVRDQGQSTSQEVLDRHERGVGAVIGVALKSLWGRKLRTLLTAFSIVLGTTMIAGTFVVKDQITNAFGAIFETGLEKTDVVLSKKTAFTSDQAQAGPLPAADIAAAAAVPGVQKAEGQIQAAGALVVGGKYTRRFRRCAQPRAVHPLGHVHPLQLHRGARCPSRAAT